MSLRFHVVDVFAERSCTGNPLAVVTGAVALSKERMLQLAAEFNFSETTFTDAVPQPGGGYAVRIFTPVREIAFAGHPILGTAAVLRDLTGGRSDTLRLDLAVGAVEVTFERAGAAGEVAWFTAPPIELGPVCERPPVARALGLDVADIDGGLPVQQARAGVAALLVPLRSLGALRRARLDLAAFAPLAAAGFAPLVYLFCREPRDAHKDLAVRFFFEAHGVREDPATGNGAAFLGAYLLEHRDALAARDTIRIEQGHEVGRPSTVLLRARERDGAREIRVGGAVIATLCGEVL